LPSNLTTNGYLDIRNTEVTVLPENLVIRTSLNGYKSKITAIPSSIKNQECSTHR